MDLGVEIIAHRNIRENIIRNKQPGPPRLTFTDEEDIHLGGVEVRMLYLGRGHTNGDTVIFFPDLRTIHSGDLVIDGMPVIDYDNGGSALEFVTTLEKMMALDFDTVIPGHGRVLTKDDVRAYIPKLKTMNDRMRELARRKVPDDQLAAQLKLDDIGWATPSAPARSCAASSGTATKWPPPVANTVGVSRSGDGRRRQTPMPANHEDTKGTKDVGETRP